MAAGCSRNLLMHNLSRVAGYLVGYSKYVVPVAPFSCSVGHRIGRVAPRVEKQILKSLNSVGFRSRAQSNGSGKARELLVTSIPLRLQKGQSTTAGLGLRGRLYINSVRAIETSRNGTAGRCGTAE